jgi:hypothetical protein
MGEGGFFCWGLPMVVNTSFNGSWSTISPLQHTSQCRKIDLEGELKLRMLDHNEKTVHTLCSDHIMYKTTIVPNEMKNRCNGEVGGVPYIIKCICQDLWYTLCLEQLYYCTGARYFSLCTLVHICSYLHYTLKLPGDSLASVLSTKPLNFTTPPTKAGYRGGGTPPKNCFK